MERYLIIILDAENINLSSDKSNFIVILEVIARIYCGIVRTGCLLSLNYNSLYIENCASSTRFLFRLLTLYAAFCCHECVRCFFLFAYIIGVYVFLLHATAPCYRVPFLSYFLVSEISEYLDLWAFIYRIQLSYGFSVDTAAEW